MEEKRVRARAIIIHEGKIVSMYRERQDRIFYTFTGGGMEWNATVTDCVFVTNSTKRCKGTSFTNWLITSDSRPVPAGLTWLATGGTKVTSSSQITALGYTLVS